MQTNDKVVSQWRYRHLGGAQLKIHFNFDWKKINKKIQNLFCMNSICSEKLHFLPSTCHTQMQRLNIKVKIKVKKENVTPYSQLHAPQSWLLIPATSINYHKPTTDYLCNILASQQISTPSSFAGSRQYSWTVQIKINSMILHTVPTYAVDFLELAKTQSWWWHCALQYQWEKYQYLSENIVPLLKSLSRVA